MKIRIMVHAQTVEVLTLAKKKVDLTSKMYKNMYLDIFKALIVKQITSKKKDVIMSTPSITNLEITWNDNLKPLNISLNANLRNPKCPGTPMQNLHTWTLPSRMQ